MNPSDISTPSVASSSGGEDVHLFTCRTLGCDKSYKKPSGLKNHMNVSDDDISRSDSFY